MHDNRGQMQMCNNYTITKKEKGNAVDERKQGEVRNLN